MTILQKFFEEKPPPAFNVTFSKKIRFNGMGLEKERKFILNDKEGIIYAPSIVIHQGYLFLDNQKEVRIRLYDGFELKKAELCIKTYITKSTRKEFEYEIPFQDAVELYSNR